MVESDRVSTQFSSAAIDALLFEDADISGFVRTQDVPAGTLGEVGFGFSTLANDWRGQCVEFEPTTGLPNVNTVQTSFEIQLAESSEQFKSIMNISAAASMSYGIYKGDAIASYAKYVEASQYSMFVVGKVVVYTEPSKIKVKGLNSLGQQALKLGGDKFHQVSGDCFAASAVYGGEFSFMLEISSRDDAELESMKADVKASAGSFGSASGSFAQSMEKISKKYNMSVKILRNGLNEAIPELTAQALQKYAMEFPAKITVDGGIHLRLLRIGLRKYTSISVSAPSFDTQSRQVEELAELACSAQKFLGQVEYYNKKQDEFIYNVGASALAGAETSATAVYKSCEQGMYKCAEKPSKCAAVAGLPSYQLQPPLQRLSWVVLPLDGTRVSLGVVPDGQTRRVRFRGIWSPSGGTDWWVAANNSAFQVIYIPQAGPERIVTNLSEDPARPGDRVELRLVDDPYKDNVKHPTDPASAALY